MKLRVGVVGLGEAWDSRHRPALRALGDRFEVRAVCAPVAHLAKTVAREFRAVPVDGYQRLVRREDVDVIMLFSEQWFGSLPILAACEAGKAVYCAASIDGEPGVLGRIRTAVEESGISFMAEFPNRQAPATLRLKELIATHLGKPRLIFCHRRLPAEPARGATSQAWRQHELINNVDWCRYVVGARPRSVVGIAHRSPQSEVEDYCMFSLDFSSGQDANGGPLAQISCGRYIPAMWEEALSFRTPAEMQVVCERGVAFIDLPSSLIWFDEAGRHKEMLDSERPVGEQSLLGFHRCVTRFVRDQESLDDAFGAQEIVLQAQRSFEEGHRLDL